MMAEKDDRYFRDLYRKTPDFKELAQLDPDFAAVCKGRDLDFNDPRAVMQLTKTLLLLDYDLQVDLPEDRLCPPVANRHNYILWLKSLLDSSSYEAPGSRLVGVDIGTGASCVYPLLGHAQRRWSFIATDIDDKNLKFARENVKRNGLDHAVKVVGRTVNDKLIPAAELGERTISFTMTNPPFYSSEEELLQSAAKKSRAPFTACSGARVEMVTEGGEVAFVTRILEESLLLRERIQWYTAMLGFLSSVATLVEKLRDNGITNYAIGELIQGSKTRRWTIGWSFQPMRPSESASRGVKAIPRSLWAPSTETEVARLRPMSNIAQFADDLSASIAALDLISWNWDKQRLEGIGRAVDKVWARAWRRRKKREMVTTGDGPDRADQGEQKCMIGFKVWVRVSKENVSVGGRWLEGHDAQAFESFLGFLEAAAQPKR